MSLLARIPPSELSLSPECVYTVSDRSSCSSWNRRFASQELPNPFVPLNLFPLMVISLVSPTVTADLPIINLPASLQIPSCTAAINRKTLQ